MTSEPDSPLPLGETARRVLAEAVSEDATLERAFDRALLRFTVKTAKRELRLEKQLGKIMKDLEKRAAKSRGAQWWRRWFRRTEPRSEDFIKAIDEFARHQAAGSRDAALLLRAWLESRRLDVPAELALLESKEQAAPK